MFGIYIVLLLHLRWGFLCLLSLSYKIAKSFLVFITYWHSLFPSTLWGFFMVDDLLSLYSCTAADYVTSGKTILKTHGTRSRPRNYWNYVIGRSLTLYEFKDDDSGKDYFHVGYRRAGFIWADAIQFNQNEITWHPFKGTFNLPGSQMDYQKIHLIVKRLSIAFSKSSVYRIL